MSNKSRGFGLTAELNKKKAAKFDPDRANEALGWLKEVLVYSGADAELIATIVDVATMEDVTKILKDGRILCMVINVLHPGCVKKINKIDNPNSPFKISKENENISNFLKGCEEKAGCQKGDLFQTVDLYECNNVPSVIDAIYSLGRKVHHHENQDIPALGPKESDENTREFTQEQIDAGKNVIGLQMGTNKCASQAGQNFGKTRAIID